MRLFRRNIGKKENVGHKLQREIIDYARTKYKDPLIAGAYHDYFGNYSRKEVCLTDAIGEKLTMGYMKTILMKYPKFTKNDEVQTEYIMEDVREAIQFLNLKEPLVEIGCNCIISGWSLVLWLLEDDQLIAKVFGWDECHPRFWTRFTQIERANKIYKYKAYYIPYPQGREAAHFSMKQERYIMYPQQPNFQHLTRGTFNRGLGYARIQPIWDAITKLRERSDSEHFRSSNFMEARYPKSYKATGQAKEFIEKVRKTDRTRGIAIEEYTNPKSGEPTGLPNVTYRPWSQGTVGGQFDTNKASSFMDNEWARLLCNLGYSQVWAVGTQAGQQEGSEINLTRDDRADIAEFSLIAPIIKKVLKKLCELEVFDLLDISEESKQLLLNEKYQIVSWKTWEYNDKMALQAAQLEHQMEMQRGTSDDRNAYDQEKENAFRINERVHFAVIEALKENRDMPMTPVMSAWAESVGAYKGQLLVKYHDEVDIFGYPYGGISPDVGYTSAAGTRPEDMGEQKYLEITDAGSKGGWIWDNILMRPSQYGMEQGRLFEKGSKIKHRKPPGRPMRFKYQPVPSFGVGPETPAEMREKKMKGYAEFPGLGVSREPWRMGGLKLAPGEGLPERMRERPPGEERLRKELPPEAPAERMVIPEALPSYRPIQIRRSALPPLFKLSRKKFNQAVSKLGIDTFGTRSIDKVKELVKRAEEYRKNNQIRYNSISMGNPMAFGIPLFYDINGKISEEYPCKKEWQKIENHQGNIWLYDDLGHGGERITVGTYDYLGWDDELDLPMVKFDYDEKLIRLKINNTDSEIIKRFDEGLEPDMSTEYYCKTIEHEGKTWQMDFRNARGEARFDGIALVEFGNCPSGHCNFERVNSKTLSEWIACCIRKHGPKGDKSMTRDQCIAAGHKKFGKSKSNIDIKWDIDDQGREGKWVTIKGKKVFILKEEYKSPPKKESMAEILARMKPQVDKEMREAMERDPSSMKSILKRLKKEEEEIK